MFNCHSIEHLSCAAHSGGISLYASDMSIFNLDLASVDRSR